MKRVTEGESHVRVPEQSEIGFVRLRKRSLLMNGVIYLIGLVVVVLAVLSFLGLS